MDEHTVEKALADLTDRVGSRVTEIEAKLSDLAQRSAPGFTSMPGAARNTQTVGQAAIASEQVKALLAGQTRSAKVTLDDAGFFNVKTITGDAGSPKEATDTFSPADRLPGIVPATRRVLRVADLLTTVQVSATVEGATVNAAAGQTSEGATKAQTDFIFELKTRPIVTVAHLARASEQVLTDSGALAQFIDTRLRQYLSERYEFEILRGDGSAGQFSGFTATGNHTAYTPVTGDTSLDTIRKAAEAVESAGFFPSAVVLNPADWRSIELLKVTGGAYLLADGNGMGFVRDGMARTVWGLQVVTSVAVQAGKFVLADFQSAGVHFARQGATVEIGFINDDFAKNLVAIRCEARGALLVTSPAAVRVGNLTL